MSWLCCRYLRKFPSDQLMRLNHDQIARLSHGSEAAGDRDIDSKSNGDTNHRTKYQSGTFKAKNKESYDRKKARIQDEINTSELLANSLSHYQRLNIENESSQQEIKSAYYNLSKLYHPDTAGDNPNAAENFRLITESYAILTDTDKRMKYDRSINTGYNPKAASETYNSKNGETDYTYLYRSRQADRIFKMKQEAFIREEMQRNPKRFQAGSFQSDNSWRRPPPLSSQLSQMEKMKYKINMARNQRDPGNFYRMHHFLILQDRLDMTLHTNYDKPRTTAFEQPPLTYTVLIAGALFCIIAYNIYQCDFPAFLDNQLEMFSQRKDKKVI